MISPEARVDAWYDQIGELIRGKSEARREVELSITKLDNG
jgi:hypothetical protein